MKKFFFAIAALLTGAFAFSASAQEEIPVQGITNKVIGRVISFGDYQTSKMNIVGKKTNVNIIGFNFGKNRMTNSYTITGPEGDAQVETMEDIDKFQTLASNAILGIRGNDEVTFGCVITGPDGAKWQFSLATMPNKGDRECGSIEGAPTTIKIVGDNDTKPIQMAMKTLFHYSFVLEDGTVLCTIKSVDRSQTISFTDACDSSMKLMVAAAASALLARVNVPLT